eukprot:TRINITY_DN3756_c0_g1_i3.p1 TRINITY_DN3756_c0_g1~~TRINITY_DN3756_c0_g1_i3.p1  ORF type:complete len:462 (-),score=91.55 TRINITY_DN3756_c0_g1_i3:43-1428(-)
MSDATRSPAFTHKFDMKKTKLWKKLAGIVGKGDSDGSSSSPGPSSPPSDRTQRASGVEPKSQMIEDGEVPSPPVEHRHNDSDPGAEAEGSQRKRDMLIVHNIDDLPADARKLLDQSGLPHDLVMKHFQLLLNVLHFRTGTRMRWSETPEDSIPPSRHKRSKRFLTQEEELQVLSVVDWKKMYKLIDQAGKGGFGAVFQAKCIKEKGKMAAIKKMPHATKRQQRQNLHELAVLSTCVHRNIVRFRTCHVVEQEMWLVMEFLEGGTFADAAKAWQFNEENLAYIAREVLHGVKYLHDNQIVHRDLKSANIMMDITGQVKLVDFGLAEDMSAGQPTHMVGSPFWMPPEMIQGRPHDYKVDVWSFAISLLEMANRRPPMIESAVKAMFTVATEGIPPAMMFTEPARWSPDFVDFLSRCLRPEPSERAAVDELLGHPFLQKADTRANMESILRRIFLSNSLLDSGF